MNQLTPEHRQMLLLIGLEGLSYREVADELGMPIGTVMSRLARARERLRALLEAGA
jgi:RNA polymerase sigma factor (sigma-70 family)